MVVNTKLRENPGLQRMPRTDRDWAIYQTELAKWVLQVANFGDGSIEDGSGTTVDGLDEIPGSVHIGDGSIKTSGEVQIDGLDELPGTLADGDSLNTINAFNSGSVQDAGPLTADDVGATTTITVAAHNIVYDAATVAYNSGSVAGLGFSTFYYVYADDPTKAGGAVTYVATVTNTDVTANKGRYFVGSVTTPADGAGGTVGGKGGGGAEIP